MGEQQAVSEALQLVARSQSVLVGSNGDGGYPNIKAMFKTEHDGLRTFLFSTNTSSRRVSHFRRDPRACLYFVDFTGVCGLMLEGQMEVLDDLGHKRRLWQPGHEMYYPGGVDDPDYSVLRFAAKSGCYYHELQVTTFGIR